MNTKDVLLIILPVMIGILSSYLTYFFTMRSNREQAILKFKEEKYTNLLLLLQGFIGQTVSMETKRKFFEEQYKSWLYSSDDVVEAINNMVGLIIEERGRKPDPKRGVEVVGNIVLAMRKDLLVKTRLRADDFRYTDVYPEKSLDRAP